MLIAFPSDHIGFGVHPEAFAKTLHRTFGAVCACHTNDNVPCGGVNITGEQIVKPFNMVPPFTAYPGHVAQVVPHTRVW